MYNDKVDAAALFRSAKSLPNFPAPSFHVLGEARIWAGDRPLVQHRPSPHWHPRRHPGTASRRPR